MTHPHHEVCSPVVSENSVRIKSTSDHMVKVLWFNFLPHSSIGITFEDFFKLKNNDLGRSLLNAGVLVQE